MTWFISPDYRIAVGVLIVIVLLADQALLRLGVTERRPRLMSHRKIRASRSRRDVTASRPAPTATNACPGAGPQLQVGDSPLEPRIAISKSSISTQGDADRRRHVSHRPDCLEHSPVRAYGDGGPGPKQAAGVGAPDLAPAAADPGVCVGDTPRPAGADPSAAPATQDAA